MDKRTRRPAAFKHGAYCRTNVMPGEDATAFKKLHDGLVAELLPNGAVEETIVADLARLYWRKQNMATYQLAELARLRRSAIKTSLLQMGDERAREELGDAWDLVEMGPVATIEYLLKDLEVAERLDGLIDRALKRLLFVRGIKSCAQTISEERSSRSIEPPKPA